MWPTYLAPISQPAVDAWICEYKNQCSPLFATAFLPSVPTTLPWQRLIDKAPREQDSDPSQWRGTSQLIMQQTFITSEICAKWNQPPRDKVSHRRWLLKGSTNWDIKGNFTTEEEGWTPQLKSLMVLLNKTHHKTQSINSTNAGINAFYSENQNCFETLLWPLKFSFWMKS